MMETMGKPDKDIDEVVKHILDDVQKKVADAYQRGVEDGRNETWEAARKIVTWPDRSLVNSDTFDLDPGESIFTKYSASEAIAKLKAYEEQDADDGIDEKITGFLERNNYTVDEVFNRLKRMKGEE